MKKLKHRIIGFSLLAGIRKVDTDIFGHMNNPIAVHSTKKSGGGGGSKQTKNRIGCMCANPMPLTRTERDLLAGFAPGRAKKRFVRELKQRHGKV